MIERKLAPIVFDEKTVRETDDAFIVTGYAATYDRDRVDDIIVPGAFRKSLAEDGLPLLLFNHKMDDVPVGAVVECEERAKGLWFKGELPKDDEFVRGRLVPQLRRRALKSMSIGYKATDTERCKKTGARLLRQIKLYEISIVNIPANPAASVSLTKASPWAELEETLSEVVASAKASRRPSPADDLAALFASIARR